MASLVGTTLQRARISQSIVYGISAWGVNLDGALQKELRVTGRREDSVTVDDLEVAQFIYLMLHNEKIRNIIDTVTSKVVLILGRFSPERKAFLDAIRNELRKGEYNLSPVLFDFSAPTDRNLTETVTLLARMARFIIADLTDPSSIPQELQAIVPHVHVPVVPLLHVASPQEYAMFLDHLDFPWVLDVQRYGDVQDLLDSFAYRVIIPAENYRRELEERRRGRRGRG